MLNNSWNKVIYKIWSPIYDKVFNSNLFLMPEEEYLMRYRLIAETKFCLWA